MAFLLFATLQLAVAAPPRIPTGAVRMSCAPASAGGRLMDMLDGGSDLLAFARDPAAVLLALPQDPDTAAAAGVDLTGPLLFSRNDSLSDQARVRLVDPDRAEHALDALGLAPQPASRGAWHVSVDQRPPWFAWVDGSDLVVSRSGDAPPPLPDSALLADRADAAGCRLTARVDRSVGGEIAGFLPADPSRPILVRVQPEHPLPATLGQPTSPPVSGTSVSPPFLVFTVGVPILELLRDLSTHPTARFPVPPAELEQLSNLIRLGAGATAAAWMEPDGLTFALSVPISQGSGRPLPARTITRKLVRRLKLQETLTVYRRGPNALRVEPEDKPAIEVVVEQHRLLVGNATRAVTQSAAGVGPPWVGPELAALAAQAPLVLETRMDQTRTPVQLPGSLRLGLRADGPRAELLIEGGVDGALVPQLLFLMGAMQRIQRPPIATAPTR